MVKIRLARRGAKKRPFYHIVAVDSRSARDGRSIIEQLGYYNPVAQGKEQPLMLKMDRVQHWLGVGAQLSERVAWLVKQSANLQPSGENAHA